ncbi:MAG: hypothetical protein JOZ38_02245 [Candidatus Eremiobacteraeota bacterium]|nr:hypothetical protein [Candidatus Eremiobacteraeota bacterium]
MANSTALPFATIRAIPRRRVIETLARAVSHPVTVVAAPAGFGKTLAVQQYLDRGVFEYLLYRTPFEVHGLAPFVAGLTDALADLIPGARLSFTSARERASLSKSAPRDLARWLSAHLAEISATVVIEDLNDAANDEAIAGFLDELFRSTSQTIKWIVVARQTGHLPVPTWMADSLIDMPIGEETLRLDLEEAQSIAHTLNPQMVAADVFALWMDTDRWVAGLTFALSHGDRPQATPLRPVQTGGYGGLYEALFETLEPDERELLLQLCYFPSIDRETIGTEHWQELRQLLVRQDLAANFIAERGTGQLRLQEPFRRFLKRRLAGAGEGKTRSVVRQSGHDLQHASRVVDALRIYGEAKQYDAAATLLEDHAFDLVERGHAALVDSVVADLPPERANTSAVILAIKALSESRLERFDVSEAWFAQALRESTGQTRKEIQYRYAIDLLRRRRPDAFDLLSELNDEGNLSVTMRTLVKSAFAEACILANKKDDARQNILAALETVDQVDDPAVRARISARAAYVALNLGDSAAAERLAIQAGKEAQDLGHHTVAVGALSVLCVLASQEERPRDCLRYLKLLGENSVKAGALQYQEYALAYAYEIETERGNTPDVDRLERSLQSFELQYGKTNSELFLPARALRLAWKGKFREAYALVSAMASQQTDAETAALRWAEAAFYASAGGNDVDARKAIAQLQENVGNIDPRGASAIRVRALEALTLTLIGDTDALRQLEGLRESPIPFARINSLVKCVNCFYDRWHVDAEPTALYHALLSMRDNDFGGWARAIEAVPVDSLYSVVSAS